MLEIMALQFRQDRGQTNMLRWVECRNGIDHRFYKLFRPDHSKDKGTGLASMFSQETCILIQVLRIDKTRDSHLA